METKELKIKIPEGYEIDKGKSTFENIVFKPIKHVNTWEEIEELTGYYINGCTGQMRPAHGIFRPHYVNNNVFRDVKYAKSSLALAKISQLLPYYDTNVDWKNNNEGKYCIVKTENEIRIQYLTVTFYVLAFNTKEEAERFLKYNEQLVKDYYMQD